MTRCKFKCISKTVTGAGDSKQVSFQFVPVTSGSDENKEFWRYTPSGRLEFSCLNPKVDFELEKEYFLDLTLA